MKNSANYIQQILSSVILVTVTMLCVLPESLQGQTVLNNDRLRIGTGSENSVNTSGNLQQPFYYNNIQSLWRKLTYSTYPLDNAFALDGDNTAEWNTNGTISPNPSLTAQVINTSGYIATVPGKGYGTIISTGTITIGGKTMEIENTYNLLSDKSYIEVKVKVKNTSAGNIENVRIWIGTRDDWVGATDGPTKQKGNLVDGAFVKITNPADRSAALKILSGDEGILFYTNSDKGNTIIQHCCSWSNVIYQSPQTSLIEETYDGSYGFYVRFNDLPPGVSDEFTWYYAAGKLADIDDIIADVADASANVSNITYTSATFMATSSLDAIGYWIVVPRNSAIPTALEIKAGTNFGGVEVVTNGSGAMPANVETIFSLAGLTVGTNYDLYFVTEDLSPAFSAVLRAQFSSESYTAPVVNSTTSANSITVSSASSGGNVSDDGGQSVTARGVCWNTTGSPTLSNNFTSDNTGTGSYASALTGLSPGTIYYISAYATNSQGTTYGSQVSFTTMKYPQAITFEALPQKIYGDDDFALSATAGSGLAVSFSSSNTDVATISDGNIHMLNAGTTIITVAQAGDETFETANDIEQSFTVGKDTLVASADDKSKIFGEANPAFTVSYSGFNFDDDVSDIDSPALAESVADETTHVGEYPVTVSDGMDNNYMFKCTAGKITIDKAMLNVTAEDKSKIYGEINPGLTMNFTGFKNSDNETIIDIAASASTEADVTSSTGVYIIMPAGAEDTDYNFNYVNGTFTILKKEIMVTADDQPIVYGETIPALTLSYSGFDNGDTEEELDTPPQLATEAVLKSPKGDYAISVSGAEDNNYSFLYTEGILTVNPRNLLITAEDNSITYGDAMPELKWKIEGFAPDDDESIFTSPVEISSTSNGASDAGIYEITVSGASAGDSYNIIFVGGTLEIKKAQLTVTADNQRRVYAQENPELTFTYQGFVKNEYPGVLDILPVVTTDVTLWTPTGEYNISPDDCEDQNYSIVYQNATFTIIKADQEIEFETIPNGLHASASHILVATATSDHEVTYISSNPEVASVNLDQLLINLEGSTVITAIQPGDDNWNATSVSQTVETTPSFGNSDYLMTPNGDGINDYWHINYLEDYGKTSVLLYNRWGKKVFESFAYANDWDGRFNGSKLPSGAYYFIISSGIKGIIKGVINIVY